jgi:3-oxoadipate enol-lactonase
MKRTFFLYVLNYTGSAVACGEKSGEIYQRVLEGAALSDLPDIENDIEVYKRIRCPVLILTVEGDKVHPVSTAEALHSVIPHSELHIASTKDSAMQEWPQLIANFLSSLFETNASCAS